MSNFTFHRNVKNFVIVSRMRFHEKISAWVEDYFYTARQAVAMVRYRKPPDHYLGFKIPGKVPVILIPGILSKWGGMKYIGDQISQAGHPVYIIPELGYNISSIPSSAEKLYTIISSILSNQHQDFSGRAERVKGFLEDKDLHGAILVGHSKGGLIGKYLLAHHNDDSRVLGLIAIASPFSGSALASLVPHSSFKELKNNSDIVNDLARHQDVNRKIISLIPEYDTFVWAAERSFLPGAENIEVPVRGHNTALFSKAMSDAVLFAIEKISTQEDKNK